VDSRHTVSGLSREVAVTHAQWRPDAAQHPAEFLAESGVAERVEERVERRVEISNPGEMCPGVTRCGASNPGDGRH